MQSKRPVAQIFAKTLNNVIGILSTNSLPFKSRVDLQAFKRYTSGNIVIMGRKTADSLKFKPLPNRINVIVSHELRPGTVPGFIVYNDIKQLMEDVQDPSKFDLTPYSEHRVTKEEIVYIVGGASIYNAFEKYVQASVVTTIVKPIGVEIPTVRYAGKKGYTKYRRALPLDLEGDDKIYSHYIQFHTPMQEPACLLDVYPDPNDLSDYTLLLKSLLDMGEEKEDRTNTGTLSLFGTMLHFHDVNVCPPFLTTRKLPLKSTIGELLWFISGCTNAHVLKDSFKCNFWDEWANEYGNIGPMYGAQWRGKTDGVDQLNNLLHEMVHNPSSRRLLVDAWNPKVLPDPTLKPHEQANKGLSALAPCHFAFQLNITSDFRVDLLWYQRSADTALGLPVNIASYYFLLCILCKAATEMTNGKVQYIPRTLSVALGDVHLYKNHVDIVREIVDRRPLKVPSFTIPDGMLELFTSGIKLQTLVDYQQKIFDGIKDYEAHPNPKLARNV